jgi:hypothetical protein
MPALTPERLSELLSRLNDVMTDAARLRRQITRQLNDQRRRLQPKITAPRRRRAKHGAVATKSTKG